MTGHIATITQARPLQGFVMHTDNLQVAIHCQCIDGEWEPLFGLKRGSGRLQLPSCFTLGDEAKDALSAAADNYKE